MHRILLSILLTTYLLAIEKIFVQDYTYQVSEYDSKITSRANALEQVKRLLLEEASVYFINEVDWTKGETLIGGKYINKEIYEQNIKSLLSGNTEINKKSLPSWKCWLATKVDLRNRWNSYR